MGRVAGSYGLRGWIKVVPDAGVAETLLAAAEWWLGEQAYRVAEARMHSGVLIAQLAGIKSREEALGLKGATVALAHEKLPAAQAGHYYLADLVGLEVVNEKGERLGAITRWLSNGAQDVMAVAGERTRLIPWVSAIVKGVDLERREVLVDWSAEW
jgi:16S rRNA processing protein RimM